MKASREVFGEDAFRKPRKRNRSPVNKALFEVCTVTMDHQSDQDLALLGTSKRDVSERMNEFMRRDPEFLNAISQGTGDVAKIRLRFGRFREKLEEALR